MSKKDFKAGMAAGVKPVAEKLENLGNAVDEVRSDQGRIKVGVSELGKNIEFKDKLRRLGLENFHDLTELEENEQLILFSLLYWLARQKEPVAPQQTYLSCLQRLLGAVAIPGGFSPQNALRNISDTDVHKVFLKIVLEYIFLGTEDWVYSDAAREIIEELDVGKRAQQEIKRGIEEEFRILGRDGLAQKYDIRIMIQEACAEGSAFREEDAQEEVKPILHTKFCVNLDSLSQKDAAPITQQIIQWLDANGLEYVTKVPEYRETGNDLEDLEMFKRYCRECMSLKTIITCYTLKDYSKLFKTTKSGIKYDVTIFDQFGCFIGQNTDKFDVPHIDIIYDEKYDLDMAKCRETFLGYYLDICSDLPNIDPTVEASKRLLHSIEEQNTQARSGGRFEKFFDGAKKSVAGIRDEMEQKITGEENDLIRKTGGSVFGMLSAVPTSLITAGLDAGRAMAKGTESISAGAIGVAQVTAFDIKYKKAIQQNILAAKCLKYLYEMINDMG